MQRGDVAVFVATKAGGDDGVVLLADAALARLLHRVAEAVLQRPLRPRGAIVGAARGRLGQQLELHDRSGALAQRVADAVRTGVAAADHDDVLAGGGDLAASGGCGAVGSGPCSRATQRLRW